MAAHSQIGAVPRRVTLTTFQAVFSLWRLRMNVRSILFETGNEDSGVGASALSLFLPVSRQNQVPQSHPNV